MLFGFIVSQDCKSSEAGEFKPGSPSPSCVLAAAEALYYVGPCNSHFQTNCFLPGTQSGAPEPLNGIPKTQFQDPKTEQIFEFYFLNTFGVIWWKNVTPPSEPVPTPVNTPVDVPVPLLLWRNARIIVPALLRVNPLFLLPMPCPELINPNAQNNIRMKSISIFSI